MPLDFQQFQGRCKRMAFEAIEGLSAATPISENIPEGGNLEVNIKSGVAPSGRMTHVLSYYNEKTIPLIQMENFQFVVFPGKFYFVYYRNFANNLC